MTLQTAAGSGGVGVAGLGEAAVRALVKLERILPSRLRRRVAAVPVSTVTPLRAMPTVDPAALVAVGAACRDRRVLELDYTAHDGAVTRRRVEPHHLVSWGRRWYLLAHDLGRDDWRTLRLDRVRPRVGPDGLATGPRFEPRSRSPVGTPRPTSRRRSPTSAPSAAVCACSPRPTSCASACGPTRRASTTSGTARCRLHLAADHADGAVLMLVGMGLEVVVESPDELGGGAAGARRALPARRRRHRARPGLARPAELG